MLSDRGSELIQCRAVVVQAAVRRFGSLSDRVDANEDHPDILRQLGSLGPVCLNRGHGVPAKGRLQENAESFFARAGLTLLKPRGARDYRGSIADVPAIAVAYLSAAEIVEALAEGGAHFGVTGRDLVHELISDPDQRSIFIDDRRFWPHGRRAR